MPTVIKFSKNGPSVETLQDAKESCRLDACFTRHIFNFNMCRSYGENAVLLFPPPIKVKCHGIFRYLHSSTYMYMYVGPSMLA